MKNEYIDSKIKELEQKANRTGQFHLDAINEKLDKLEHNYKKLEGNIGALTTAHNMGVELAKEDNVYNHNKINKLDNKIDEKVDNSNRLLQDATRKIFTNIDNIDERINDIISERVINHEVYDEINHEQNAKIISLERSIPDIDQPTAQTKALKEDYDILEGKYHQLRSELDSIYKVLEMDALDIQALYEKLENHPKKNGVEEYASNLIEKNSCVIDFNNKGENNAK